MNANICKKILAILPVLGLLVFPFPMLYKILGTIGWDVLILVVFSRPLASVFPQVNAFKKLLSVRKELWILSWVFILAHSVGYFLASDLPLATSLVSAAYWDFSSFFGWGMLGTIVMIPVLVTSNVASMKLLGAHWKTVQRLTYLFFIFGAIHLALVHPMNAPSLLLLVLFWALLWVLAHTKIHIQTSSSPIIAFVLVIFLLTCSLNLYKAGGALPPKENTQEQSTESTLEETEDENADTALAPSSDTQELASADTPGTLAVSSACIGCGKCARIDPAHFQMSARQATVISQSNLDTQALTQAIRGCHARAITLG